MSADRREALQDFMRHLAAAVSTASLYPITHSQIRHLCRQAFASLADAIGADTEIKIIRIEDEQVADGIPLERSMYVERLAGMLHDVGKLFITEAILNKTEKLTDAEWDIIRLRASHAIRHARVPPGQGQLVAAQHRQPDDRNLTPCGLSGCAVRPRISMSLKAFSGKRREASSIPGWLKTFCGSWPATMPAKDCPAPTKRSHLKAVCPFPPGLKPSC